MRIAYFTDTFAPQVNGVTHTLNQLKDYLEKNAHQSLFFAPDYGQGKETDPFVIRSSSIPFLLYDECRLSVPNYENIKKRLDAFEPDLIHLVTPLSLGQAGLRYAKSRKIPLVSSFHTNFDTYLNYYNAKSLEHLLWHCFRQFHSNCLMNFCPSKNTKATMEERGIENVRIWSRGIHTDIFSPGRRNLSVFEQYESQKSDLKNKKRILYTGRLAAEKDLDILMQAIDILNQEFDNLLFYFVGDGPLKAELLKKNPGNCIFTGYKSGDALAAFYASCDLFAFPSTTETYGNVILEAMASGLPVVCAAAGGVLENVIHLRTGLLSRPRDATSLANNLATLLRNESYAKNLASGALRHVQQKTWDSVFHQLVQDYLDACEPERMLQRA